VGRVTRWIGPILAGLIGGVVFGTLLLLVGDDASVRSAVVSGACFALIMTVLGRFWIPRQHRRRTATR
jgi:hypothetical protein